MSTSRQEQLLSRLNGIVWFDDAEAEQAAGPLLNEFLRNAAGCAQRFDVSEAWPFADYAGLIAPEIRTDERTSQELTEKLDGGCNSIRDQTKRLMSNALRCAAAKDSGVDVPAELEELYEPLVRIVESGWPIEREHGYLQVGAVSVFVHPIDHYLQ